ncbi:MAG: helix-turn-helix transcriptional regulator, partial [Ancrocorticia sp.]|uniref:helix-turn-helix transcriptional regulator n=1 Tax=Ancrocorticia sp. TaxID=2593684 RepID=UPI003F8E7821
ATGQPPMEYLAALRFAEAKRLLLTSDEPVVDVCAEVGFSSLSTFTRRFRDAVGTAPAELRRLAESVAERPVVPFEVGDPRQPSLQVRLDFGTNADSRLRMPRQTWIGWYARPVPVGLPAAGVLLSGDGPVSLPLSIGNPWLLAVSMHADADPVDQLAPSRPLVAGYQVPLTLTPHKHELPPGITLRFTPADMHGVPLLSALASLRG